MKCEVLKPPFGKEKPIERIQNIYATKQLGILLQIQIKCVKSFLPHNL